jgi:hypothetical protein
MESREKKLTLLLLCYIFGIFGIHRFYTGKYISGTLQLLIPLTVGMFAALELRPPPFLAIPAMLILLSILVWWLLDIMRIIMGKFTDREGKPITEWI